MLTIAHVSCSHEKQESGVSAQKVLAKVLKELLVFICSAIRSDVRGVCRQDPNYRPTGVSAAQE